MSYRMTFKLACWVAALGLVAPLWTTAPALAQDAVADFYRGKRINLVIGASPGGGYDTYARLLSRHMSKYIPGNPAIVAQNMPGASSSKAASYIYSQAPKDGTTIGTIFPGVIMDPLLGEKSQPGLDPSKFVYLGSASTDVFLCFVRSDAPVKSFQDVLAREAILGATGEGGSNKTFPAMLNNIVGAKFRLVSGYPGSRELLVAIDRSEVQGGCGLSWSSLSVERADWFSNGFARILVQEHAKGHPALNRLGVPLAVDFAKSPEDRRVLELVYSQEIFGRPYVLPPGTPQDRIAALRAAFLDTLKDKELLAEAQKLSLDIDPIGGAELQALVAQAYGTPDAIVARAKDAMVYRPPR